MRSFPLRAARWSVGAASALVLLTTAMATPAAALGALHPAAAVVRTRSIAVAPEAVGRLNVRCPAGMVAVGGGVSLAPPPGVSLGDVSAKLLSSAPTADGRGWHGAMTSAVEPGMRRLTVRVRCRPAAAVGAYAIRTRDVPFSTGDTIDASLGCGKGKRIVTGGVVWGPSGLGGRPPASANLFVSSPDATARRWRASGFAYNPGVLRIILLCRPAASVGGIVVAHAEVTGSGLLVVPATCPAGRRATAGGADWTAGGGPTTGHGTLQGLMISADGTRVTATADPSAPELALRVTLLCVVA